MVFRERGIQRHVWKLGGKTIQQVDSYKYLGVVVKQNLRWDKFKHRLLEKAKKASVVSFAMGIRSGNLTVAAALKIWNMLVRPLLEYGAEIWGPEKWEMPKNYSGKWDGGYLV